MPPKPPHPSPPRLTHFLCLPLLTPTSKPQLLSSLTSFRTSITKRSTPQNPNGIPDRAIRPLGTLHLTLGVMSLPTKERVDGAVTCLRASDLERLLVAAAAGGEGGEKSESADGKGTETGKGGESQDLKVTLRGLESMHDPTRTSILYAPPVDDADGRLQRFCQSLRDVFVESGFIVPENRPLLLHATILNTVYVPGVRARDGKGGHGRNKAKLTIDATEIIEDWADREWMSQAKIEKVAICRMGAKKTDDGGEEYVVEEEVKLP